MNYRHLGLLAVALIVIGIVFVLYTWPQNRNLTLSQHVARKREAILFYSALFFVTMPILVTFFIKWFVPEFRISGWFTAAMVGSAVSQCACTLVPETGGKQSMYHRILAGISAALLLPALVILLVQDSLGAAQKVVVAGSLLVMLCVVAIAARAGDKHTNSLILQIVYFASFFLPILFITYG